MSIPEITAALRRLGHKSSGERVLRADLRAAPGSCHDFRRVLSQTLLSDPRFVRAERGVYRRRRGTGGGSR